MKNKLFVVLVLLVLVALFGCTEQGPTPIVQSNIDLNSANTKPSFNSVAISNMSFSPSEIRIKAGDVVVWNNSDSVAHTVTSDTSAFESGNLTKGASYSFMFKEKGTFAYHCTYHPSMKGTIIVE